MSTRKPSRQRTEPPTWRRQANESFCDPGGNFSAGKTIAIAGQVMVLYYTGRYFGDMLAKPETLLVCLAFIIAPDVLKKFVSMKSTRFDSQFFE